MKRTVVTAAFVGVAIAYVVLSGGVLDGAAPAAAETEPSHDVQIRSLDDAETQVTVRVLRHDSVVMERNVTADETFSQVLRLQGTGEFTLVVATESDSTTVDLERIESSGDCTGHVDLKFSVESNALYLSTERAPGNCFDS